MNFLLHLWLVSLSAYVGTAGSNSILADHERLRQGVYNRLNTGKNPYMGNITTSTARGCFSGPDLKVILGNEADILDHPWQASLQADVSNIEGSYDWRHICGAVLISDKWLATAAHCVVGYFDFFTFRVRLGIDDLTTSDNDTISGQQSIVVKNAFVYPDYSDNADQGFPGDFAVLELEHPATLSDKVQPLTISWLFDFSSQIFGGNYECKISGFGVSDRLGYAASDQLLEGVMETISNEECTCNMAIVGGDEVINKRHICIKDPEKIKSACFGDSGGPLTCRFKGTHTWYLVGVTSWVVGCIPDMPQAYTRVSSYCDWIEEMTDVNCTPGPKNKLV